MDAACLRQTLLPHTTRLFEDLSYHFDRVARFYGHPPTAAAIRDVAAGMEYPDDRRAALIEALRRQNGDSPSLRELAKPGTVAVVTGQQVGLFSGPSYTVYKALTAVRIAARLREQGVAAVPVFWLATEDHDLAEVDHAWTFGPSHQPLSLRAQGAALPQQPVGGIQLTGVPLKELKQTLGGFPFGEEIADDVASAYLADRTMGESFRELLKRLLARYDLLYVDPLDEGIRRLGAPLLREAVRSAPDIKASLLARNEEIRAAGYHTQVHLEPQTSLVFLLEGGRRLTLRSQNGDYLSKDRRYSAEELMDSAERLSPNALLRPVMQDYMLPTAAYVGGPAELAYFAQAQAIYQALLGRMPVVVHRAGFTLLDARADKLLKRYQLNWPTVFTGEDGIRDHIANHLVPPDLKQTAASTAHDIAAQLDRYHAQVEAFDPTLGAALVNSRRKILYQLSKLEHKTARETLGRNARARQDAAYLAGLLYPNKHLQERLYTILPFLAKHGPTLIDSIYEHVEPDCPDHRILVV